MDNKRNLIMYWIDKIPLLPLGVISVFLLFAPFVPEPHLWQKLKMLMEGSLTKPIDVFDLFWHLTPLSLFIFIIIRKKFNK